jgi:DNA-binding MarR family transcriptional regulator
MSLEVGDPLAHRALEALLRAETSMRRVLGPELERAGLSPAGFSALVVLTTAGGRLELRTLRNRLRWSKANATEVTSTLAAAGLVTRKRDTRDRRAVIIELAPAGAGLVEQVFPEHTRRVSRAFERLDEAEKRSLAELCRKLAA